MKYLKINFHDSDFRGHFDLTANIVQRFVLNHYEGIKDYLDDKEFLDLIAKYVGHAMYSVHQMDDLFRYYKRDKHFVDISAEKFMTYIYPEVTVVDKYDLEVGDLNTIYIALEGFEAGRDNYIEPFIM